MWVIEFDQFACARSRPNAAALASPPRMEDALDDVAGFAVGAAVGR
jgi:hypothetical protein